MAGLWYEEFEIGREWKHPITRTVTEMDNILFTALTHNPQPLHLDEEFAKENSQFGQRIVNSIFTLGLMIGVSVEETTLGTTVGNLGMTDCVLPQPRLPRRHDHLLHEGSGQAREPVPAGSRHRHLRALGVEPARARKWPAASARA